MYKIEVGQLYVPGHSEYPEGCEFNFSNAGYELRLFYGNPNRNEINAVRKGKANFGLFIHEQVIFLLWQFKPQPWSDSPFCYSMTTEDRRGIPEAIPEAIPDGMGVALQIILINAATGVVEAIRQIGLETEFSRALVGAIETQITNPISPQEYSYRVDRAYQKYPGTLQMLRATNIQQ
jgi:hypothetical protein